MGNFLGSQYSQREYEPVDLFLTLLLKTYLVCSWPGHQMYVDLLNSFDRRSDFLDRFPGESEICEFVIDEVGPFLTLLQDTAFHIWLFLPPMLC